MINVVFNLADYSPVEEIELANQNEVAEQLSDIPAESILKLMFNTEAPYYRFIEETQLAVNNSKNVHLLNGYESDGEENSLRLFSELGGQLYTQGYVGSVNYTYVDKKTSDDGVISKTEYNITVNFRSRFDDDKSLFLMYVFEKAFDLKGRIFEDMKVKTSNESAFDLLLVLLWFKRLNNALKKGVYRCYREFEYNDSAAKGRLDITRHIKENMGLSNGRICFANRELTADNSMNRLILKALECLQARHGTIVRQLLKSNSFSECDRGIKLLQNEMFDADLGSDTALLNSNRKKIVHSVFRAYEPLRETCIMILRRYGMNHTRNQKQEASGLLISMPGLWERFLYNDIFRFIIGSNSSYSQKSFKIIDGKRTIKPDLMISGESEDTYLMVLDAKYKAVWGEMFKPNVHPWDNRVREDVFQVLSYMYVFKSAKGGVVFPLSAEQDDNEVLREYNIYKNCGDFLLIAYRIPNGDNLSDFRKEMQETSEKIRNKIKELINDTDTRERSSREP